jgi:hypothetical protein
MIYDVGCRVSENVTDISITHLVSSVLPNKKRQNLGKRRRLDNFEIVVHRIASLIARLAPRVLQGSDV